MSAPCALLLAAVGLGTGILSGLFGVGGGFVIVPALVLFSGMGVHRAVATSLLVISLIGASGVGAMVLSGRAVPIGLTAPFVAGGILGLMLSTKVGRRLTGPRLQKLFAGAILATATFILIQGPG